jgi:GNAT superfamily N-acetyltransferase
LRHYGGEQDIAQWLAVRHAAFARQRFGVRQWTEADFQTEFLHKWWWAPQRMWFAEAEQGLQSGCVGAVAMAFRGKPEAATPVVHWLAVLPAWRRRGIASHLMTALEQACWDAGYRRIDLETHVGWTAAVEFYRARGYEDAVATP